MSRAREFPLLSAEVTQQPKQQHTGRKNSGQKEEKEERRPAHVHCERRTRCLAQVKAVTNHWERSSGGAQVGLIEMNFMVGEDERRRRHLIKRELFYLPFVSTSRGP